ncbi:hypothetical protein B7463_g11321, partial [Scytalidium lignicola]
MQIFLGFTGFYRQFIKGYSKVATPLTDTLKKGHPSTFQLTLLQREAFTKMHVLFTTAPLLRHYNPKLPTRLETNASDFAVGMIMTQFTPDAELLAIVEAFRTWRHYLSQAHWLQELSRYDFKIEYRPGSQNLADGLSRRPDLRDTTGAVAACQELLPSFLSRFSQTPNVGSEEPASLLGQGLVDQSKEVDSLTTELVLPDGQDLAGRSQEPNSSAATELEGAQSIMSFQDNATVKATSRKSYVLSAQARRAEAATAPEDLLPSFADVIRKAQQKDAFVVNEEWKQRHSKRSIARVSRRNLWALGDDELLRYRGHVYIPDNHPLKIELLDAFHNAPTSGHLGITKVLKRLANCYHWNSLRKDVKKPFEEISMDFITKLPPSTSFEEHVYNTSWYSAIQTSPAEALMGYKPQGPAELGLASGEPPFKVPAATKRAEELQESRSKIASLLQHAQKLYEKWYNQRQELKSFNLRDWVLVSTAHIKQQRPCRKFADKYLGPWKITKVVRGHGLAYELDMPK